MIEGGKGRQGGKGNGYREVEGDREGKGINRVRYRETGRERE